MTFNKALAIVIEDAGARAWQKGFAFWCVPEYRAARDRKAWGRGYDRAAQEFGDIYEGRYGHSSWEPSHGWVW